jgi:2-oxoglutarate ferredoxin oxidoreductase subunit alpha
MPGDRYHYSRVKGYQAIMDDLSVLIAGKAGFGIDKAGSVIAGILNQLNYRLYIYRDYPSVIRGGHTFSIIRASSRKIAAHKDKVDFLLALNQDTIDFHKDRLKSGSVVLYDCDTVKSDGIGIPIGKIIQEEKADEIMRNTCIIGAFCKAAGIEWGILDRVFRKLVSKELDLNLKVARRGYDAAKQSQKIDALALDTLPLLTGNEAIGLGLLKGGLGAYVAYPMTPSSAILHFMANAAQDFGLKVIHPESEISVILMALGFAYAGEKAAVGTSGGGFCLMTEALSFAGMAELPVVIVVGQRPGPSTGLPTYSCQSELHFVLNAGQGEFPRFIVAPGDAEEAYYWSCAAVNLAWKYQIPSIILSDKTLAEGTLSFDIRSAGDAKEEPFPLWDRKGSYKRYLNTESGVSPLAFPPEKDNPIKVDSYEHDEAGITTEDASITTMMQDKRLRKEAYLAKELEAYPVVKAYGDKDASTALLCWGSNKGVCIEVAQELGLKVIQPQVLWPFPVNQLREAVKGVDKLICVENNARGQLANLISPLGFKTDGKILKYDGRPFSLEELTGKVKEALK